MAKKIDHNAQKISDKLDVERMSRIEGVNTMSIIKAGDFASDLELIAWLELKVGTEMQKVTLAKSMEWMDKTKRSLMPAIRNKYLRWSASIKRHERNGTAWVPDPNFKPTKQRATVIKKVQPPRPDWMDNPALLPKRPPGKS